ncbi:MAG: NTP transferase domain-containing protein [Nitrospinae bacterium]|nr:NTP transferase domain-containing protein [Nitrospinota bacterium]
MTTKDAAKSGLAVVILAAGKGTRMKSDLPKVLHKLAGRPLVSHVVETAEKLSPDKIIVVVGYKGDLVRESLAGKAVLFAEQAEQLGTAHAVASARKLLEGFKGAVIVLSGDVPLIDAGTLRELVELRERTGAGVALLSAEVDNPTGYGRIIRVDGRVTAIVEEYDADAAQKRVKEMNAGVYVFDADFLFVALEKIRPDNAQKEYYLPDVARIALESGVGVSAFKTEDYIKVTGVNRPEELETLNRTLSTGKGI